MSKKRSVEMSNNIYFLLDKNKTRFYISLTWHSSKDYSPGVRRIFLIQHYLNFYS